MIGAERKADKTSGRRSASPNGYLATRVRSPDRRDAIRRDRGQRRHKLPVGTGVTLNSRRMSPCDDPRLLERIVHYHMERKEEVSNMRIRHWQDIASLSVGVWLY